MIVPRNFLPFFAVHVGWRQPRLQPLPRLPQRREGQERPPLHHDHPPIHRRAHRVGNGRAKVGHILVAFLFEFFYPFFRGHARKRFMSTESEYFKHHDFVWTVILPEALIKIYMVKN